MLKPSAPHDADAEMLSHIRTGEDMDKGIDKAANPPGYSRRSQDSLRELR
jgi:hypothetical protein